MDLTTKFEALEARTSDGIAAVRQAASDTKDQLRERIDQTQVQLDLARKDLGDSSAEAAETATNAWLQVKADAAVKVDEIRSAIDRKSAEHDAKVADRQATAAEVDAADAVDFAAWAIDSARLAVLDALEARLIATDRAAAAGDA